MSSDLSGAVPTGAAAACDAIGARMLAGHLREGGAGSTISENSEAGRGSHDGAADHRNVLACPVGLALALAVLRAGAADAGTDAALGIDSAPGTDAAPALGADGAPRVGVGTPDSIGPGAPGDSAAPLPRDLVWSAVQRALRRFDVAGPEQLRSFNPDAIPETPLVHIANNILVVGEHVVRQDYLEAAKHWYDAEISRTPLAEAKTALDAWADLHTGGLIKQSAIVLRPDTVLVLQNALLFAARWERRFTKASTVEKQPFTRADGSTSRADLMTSTRPYTLVAGPGWRALRLPYNGGGATGGGRRSPWTSSCPTGSSPPPTCRRAPGARRPGSSPPPRRRAAPPGCASGSPGSTCPHSPPTSSASSSPSACPWAVRTISARTCP